MSPAVARRAGARWRGALLSAVALAACTTDHGVRTISADQPAPSTTGAPPTTAASPTTEPPPEPPPEPAPDSTDQTTPPDPADEPDLASAGDSLYPDVGNADIDVVHYDVRIAYDPAVAVIEGHVTIALTATADLDAIVLDAVDVGVESVAVGGTAATFMTSSDELVIDVPAAAGDEVVVDIEYRDTSATRSGAFGLDIGWFTTPNGAYVLNEPEGLRTWMPAHDHPSDKATWHFELTVPSELAGIANGAQSPPVSDGDDTTWIWDQRDPMATYLVQLLIGEYTVVDGGMAGDTPLVHVALTDDIEQMQPYFDATAAQVAFFESVFGPYPLDRYGLAFTESYPGLAMETQGRSMFSSEDFPGTMGFLEELLLSHELAHQWFGDAVSPADWSDLWLNESFATYGQWLWFDHQRIGPLESNADFALALRQEAGSEPTGSPSVDNLFGFERYDGGAVVLHALRRQVGDEAFFEILQRWVADNDGTSRTSAHFIALAEEVTAADLGPFFDDWLYAAQVPAAYPS